MKRVISIILTAAMVAVMGTGVFAEGEQGEFTVDQKLIDVIYNRGANNNMRVTILDKKHYDETEQSYKLTIFPEDCQPFIDENGRTQIPLRAIANELDFAVDWNEAEKKITLSKDSDTVIFHLGSDEFTVNSDTKKMDTTPVLVNDYTFIPLRFVGEAVGYTVEFTDRSNMALEETHSGTIEDMQEALAH